MRISQAYSCDIYSYCSKNAVAMLKISLYYPNLEALETLSTTIGRNQIKGRIL
jgi:hypothetical protein